MQSAITKGIVVSVATFYHHERPHRGDGSYLFGYKITITNKNEFTVQLKSRKWIITNGYGEIEVVEGEGVVGRQPILYAGESYEYVSGCPLPTPIGSMHGFYYFENKENQTIFSVQIPLFRLEAPQILN